MTLNDGSILYSEEAHPLELILW